MDYHDAIRQLDYVKQSLSQNKKHIGFFIGAGCPLSIWVDRPRENGVVVSEALIPDVAGLTAEIAKRLNSPDPTSPSSYQKITALFVEDEHPNFNIEDILSLIRSMSSIAGRGVVRGLTAPELEQLDKDICIIISDIVDKNLPDGSTAYSDLAIWARSLTREKPVHIFTTNYDLLMEEALERAGAPYFDGFIGSRKAFFDLAAVENERLLPSRWSRLWKMHGSINWKIESDPIAKTATIVRSDTIEDGQKHLIYPSHLKYDQSRKMPYLAMLDRVKDFLLYPASIMFMSGYSFSDDHINDTILSGLKANPSAMVYAFLYGSIDQASYTKARGCAAQTPNLIVAGFDGAIIGRLKAPWQCVATISESMELDGVIQITGAETPDNNGKAPCALKLGDFAVFGKVLKSLSVDAT